MPKTLLRRAVLTGTGAYLPEQIVTNEDMAKRVETSDAWIVERTGIRQRHFAGPHETNSFMGTQAAQRALAAAGVSADEVGAVIVGTSTPDQVFPSTAVNIQTALGAKTAFGFDLSAACSGFIYGLSMADAMIRAGQVDTVLVVGVETVSRVVNFEDRASCVLFGDGAGAVVLQARDVPADGPGLLSTHLHSNGEYGGLLYLDGAVGQKDKPDHIVMNGKEVFRHAVTLLAGAVTEALTANNVTAADIDWLVPHQANLRIIEGVEKRLGLSPERVVVTVDRHANTSAASIPLALAEAVADGRIKPGQLVLMEALGGGLTWGAALLRL